MLNNQYQSNPYLKRFVRIWAKGICALCRKNAPFNDKNDDPYLEGHHIEWLSKGGKDEITNVVALCPNCHKKMHVRDDKEDVEILEKHVTEREPFLP